VVEVTLYLILSNELAIVKTELVVIKDSSLSTELSVSKYTSNQAVDVENDPFELET
jgi:hypothetical protein